MSTPNQNAKVSDYYGFWQLYPNNIRSRRLFLQFEALKMGGPFCARAAVGLTTLYHVAYYTYQFTMLKPEDRRDLSYIIYLMQKLPFCASIGNPYNEEVKNNRI